MNNCQQIGWFQTLFFFKYRVFYLYVDSCSKEVLSKVRSRVRKFFPPLSIYSFDLFLREIAPFSIASSITGDILYVHPHMYKRKSPFAPFSFTRTRGSFDVGAITITSGTHFTPPLGRQPRLQESDRRFSRPTKYEVKAARAFLPRNCQSIGRAPT